MQKWMVLKTIMTMIFKDVVYFENPVYMIFLVSTQDN